MDIDGFARCTQLMRCGGWLAGKVESIEGVCGTDMRRREKVEVLELMARVG